MKQRPFLVTIIGIVMVVVGVLQVALGAVSFVNRHDAKFLADAGKSSDFVSGWGIALIILGALSFILGLALLKGSNFARMLVGIFEVLQIAGGIYLLTGGHSSQKSSAVGTIVGAVIVLYFLFGTQKAKEFFA